MPQQPKRRPNDAVPTSQPKALASATSDAGALGEALVAQWWRDRGWLVLQERWHCRWGELDLVVGQPSLQNPTQPIALAFVEVKTRSRGNWDGDGALAITARKRAKLWKTAQLFLTAYPAWAELPCQFDVALVCCRAIVRGSTHQSDSISLDVAETQDELEQSSYHAAPLSAQIQQRLSLDRMPSIEISGYRLTLQDYIPAAFTLD